MKRQATAVTNNIFNYPDLLKSVYSFINNTNDQITFSRVSFGFYNTSKNLYQKLRLELVEPLLEFVMNSHSENSRLFSLLEQIDKLPMENICRLIMI